MGPREACGPGRSAPASPARPRAQAGGLQLPRDRAYGCSMPAMVRIGPGVSLAADRSPHRYGATMIWVHDRARNLVRTEVRGRDVELLNIVQFVELDDGQRVTSPEQTSAIFSLDSGVDELRERVRQTVYQETWIATNAPGRTSWKPCKRRELAPTMPLLRPCHGSASGTTGSRAIPPLARFDSGRPAQAAGPRMDAAPGQRLRGLHGCSAVRPVARCPAPNSPRQLDGAARKFLGDPRDAGRLKCERRSATRPRRRTVRRRLVRSLGSAPGARLA